LNQRQSVLNRTMVVSKRSRRPGLPEVSTELIKDPQQCIQTNGHFQSTDEKIRSTSGHSDSENLAPIATNKNSTNKKPSSIMPIFEQFFVETEKLNGSNSTNLLEELKKQAVEVIQSKEREWMVFVERIEMDKKMNIQVAELKLSVANKTCDKAAKFFKICEECGIDIDNVLCRSLESIRRLRQIELSPKSSSEYANGSPSPSDHDQSDEINRISSERDTLTGEVRSLEENYSNLFRLYEKMRMNCLNSKETEDALRNELAEQTRKYSSLYAMYSELLIEAQRKLEEANAEVIRIERENEEKTLGTRLALKRAQIRNDSLENALQSKIKENEELNKICNQLLSAREAKENVDN